MNYCIFTFEGNGLPIAQKLIAEGHNVIIGVVENEKELLTPSQQKLYETENKQDKTLRLGLYKNIVETIPAQKLIDKLKTVSNPQEYFLFFETNTLFNFSDQVRHLNFHGNFPTAENRSFETDRDLSKDFVGKYYPKLLLPPKMTFKKITEAIAFLKQAKEVWVVKTQSDVLSTFVPESDIPSVGNKQAIDTLELFKDIFETYGIFLELKIPNLVEIAVEKVYYNGKAISCAFDLENKFIGSGNMSFQVGCAGDLNIPISMKNPIHDIAFPPIVDEIAKKHKGLFFWDAAILINGKTHEMYFAEFCPNRPRYSQIFTYFEQVGSVHTFFSSVSQEKNPFSSTIGGSSISLFNLLRDNNGNVLKDVSVAVKKDVEKHIWLYDVYKKTKNGNLLTAGYDNILGLATGSGKDIPAIIESMYSYLDGFSMGQVYYRPKFDFTSKEYSSSILNRLEYSLKHKLFTSPII